MPGSGPERRFAGLSRDSVLLALASLFADISSEMLYPILPTFLTQSLKAGGSIVGLGPPQANNWHVRRRAAGGSAQTPR